MKKIITVVVLMIGLSLLLLTGCEGVVTPSINSGSNVGDTQMVDDGESVDTEVVESIAEDTTKPIIIGSRDPLPNSSGWNNTDVTVTFSCEDVGEVQSGIVTNTVEGATVTTEGKDQSVTNTGTCIDAAGNVADPVTVSGINIDKTPPVVTVSLPKNGKFKLKESITVNWSSTDDLSGVKLSKAPKKFELDTNTKGWKNFTLPPGLVEDEAGNPSEEVTIPYEVVDDENPTEGEDITKPVITGSRSPLPNASGWNNTDVKVTFTCEDVGEVQSGIVTNMVEGVTVTTEGKDQSVTNTGTCIDAAGNVADPVTISGINIDKTPPVVTLTLPGTGEYTLNQSVTATWSATDKLAGVVSPSSGTVLIDTNSIGTKILTLPAGTAKDKAGNSSLKVTKSYSVIADAIDPVIIEPQDPNTIYPQTWATGTGTASSPWAGDCIDKAIAAASAGDTVYLRAGYYQLSGVCVIKKDNLTIMGAGIGETIVRTDNAHGFFWDGYDYITIQDLTIDGSKQTDSYETKYYGIYPANCNYATIRNVEVKDCGNCGINVWQCNHGLYENLLLHDNYEHGIHPGANATGRNHYNTYRNIDAWSNIKGGFDDRGNGERNLPLESSYNVYENIHTWDNASNGITISYQKDITVNDCIAENNDIAGFRLTGLSDTEISNCISIGNGGDAEIILTGVADHPTYNISNVKLTNVVGKNNIENYGVKIAGIVDGLTFTSCQFYDDQKTMTQRYGIRLLGTDIQNITIVNCKLSPNRDGDIWNPYNITINVVTK